MAEIYGLTVPDLPEGWQPIEVAAIVKCLVPSEEDAFPYRLAVLVSDGLTTWETTGMMRCAEAEMTTQYVNNNEHEDDT